MKQFAYLHKGMLCPCHRILCSHCRLHKGMSQVSTAKARLQLPFATPNWILYTTLYGSLSVKKDFVTWDQVPTIVRLF